MQIIVDGAILDKRTEDMFFDLGTFWKVDKC